MRSKGGRGPRASFSLIEMMVAVAVIGGGIVGVARGLSQSVEAQRRVEERRTAVALLDLKLAEFGSVSQPIEAREGKFDSPYEGYGWRVEVKSTEFAGLVRVEAEVNWRGRRIERTIRAETLAPQL